MRILNLRIKINKHIINKLLRILNTLINYVNLIKHFINIDLHLRKIKILLKINSHFNKKTMMQKKKSSHDKFKFFAANKDSKFNARSAKKDKNKSKKMKRKRLFLTFIY